MKNNISKLIERLDEIQESGKYTVFYRYYDHSDYLRIEIYKGISMAFSNILFNKEYFIRNGKLIDHTFQFHNHIKTNDRSEIEIETLIDTINNLTN